MKTKWPFQDPENVAVFTTRSIVKKKKPILYVSHDDDDGAWQFHDGAKPDPTQAIILTLREIVALDRSVAELADLPMGWTAERASRSQPWVRTRKAT
jgi:hypothetical protein